MSSKKLINLARKLEFKTENEYKDYILDSWINGAQEQAVDLYFNMLTKDRFYFLQELITENIFTDLVIRILKTTLKVC